MEDPEYSEVFRPKQKNYGVCGFWCLLMLMIVIGGLVFAVVYLSTVDESGGKDGDDVSTTPASDTSICETPACVSLAASLIKNSDQSIEPCDNFYDFACGNWIRDAEIPAEQMGRANVPLELVAQLEKDLKYVLETPEIANEPEATKKAKSLYRACMDKDKREANGITGLLDNSQYDLGGWPILEDKPGGNFNRDNFDLTALLAKLYKEYASSSLIQVEASEDPNDPSQFTLFVREGKVTALESESYLLDDTEYKEQQDAYLKYMTDIAVAFGAADPVAASLEMQAVMAFEKELAQAKADSAPTPDQVTTVGDMQAQYPEINWAEFLATILPSNIGPVTDTLTLVNTDSAYLRAALDIISAKPERLTADWMLWLSFEAYTVFLTDEIRNIYSEYNTAITDRAPSSYYEDCVKVVDRNLVAATGRLYADKFFPAESKSMVEDLAEDILKVMSDLVEKSDNFDANAMQQAIETLETMAVNVGYPEYILNDVELDAAYSDLVIPRDKLVPAILNAKAWAIQQNLALLENAALSEEYLAWHDVRINAVGARYNPINNSLNLHVGILQEPFFSKDSPWYVNYATMGMFIAQVASYAVTDIGDYTDESACIKTQYGGYSIGADNLPLEIDLTHAEDLADNVGMQAAIQAFIKEVDEGYKTSLLPGFNMTAEQLFFLSNTQVWCDKIAPESLPFWLSMETGSPGRFRATGMLQNSEYFSEVFNCPADSFMNPNGKCKMW